MQRFECVKKNQESETLHFGTAFSKIFLNYRSAKCSICGIILAIIKARMIRNKVKPPRVLPNWCLPENLYPLK